MHVNLNRRSLLGHSFFAAAALGPASRWASAVEKAPLFKISPEPAVRAGVESTVVALMELLK